MGSYEMQGAELDTDIYYLNLSNRAYNALRRKEINTIGEFLMCTEADLYNLRNLGVKSANEVLEIQTKVRDVLSGSADLDDSESFLIFCALNRSKVIRYFSEYSDQPISDLPFSTNLKNRLYLAGYRKLSQIMFNTPYEADDPMWGNLEKIFSVCRYYLREEKAGVLDYINTAQLNPAVSPDTTVPESDSVINADEGEGSNAIKSEWSNDTPVCSLALSPRSEHALMRNEIVTFGQLMRVDRQMLEGMRGLGAKSIEEILDFIQQNKESASNTEAKDNSQSSEKNDLQRRIAFDEYVQNHDFKISMSTLPVRVKNGLVSLGIQTFTELRTLDLYTLSNNPNIGKTSINTIRLFIDSTNSKFMNEFNECYVDGHYTSAYIQKLVLSIFREVPFKGYSYRRIRERMPESFSDAEVKEAIGKLIAANELEYVDYRCYKVYPSFYDYLDIYLDTLDDERAKLILSQKLNGKKLREIAEQIGISHERVRQLVNKEIRKLKHKYLYQTGYEVFDEDYYQYLWINYSADKNAYMNYLGMPEKTYIYLNETYSKGKAPLADAVNDEDIDTALKLKITAYLNKDKIEIDGQMLDKKKSIIEDYVISEYCREDTHIDDFMRIYNDVLRKNGVAYDESIYASEESEGTRSNRIADSDCVLWKEGKTFRYYNIKANDYTDLLDTLNLPSYKNTEISTLKFMWQYPELMAAYDIRDQYELHNLLRKIVDPSTCNQIDFNRNPVLKFGDFDRDAAIYELICAFSPVSLNDLLDYIHDEYGYSHLNIQMNMLNHFTDYYHKGVYTVEFQRIPEDRIEPFKHILTESFYYIEQMRRKYTELFEGADENDINPYTLKGLGFIVNSNYAIQHFESARDYFTYVLTNKDVYDVSLIRQKYGNIKIYEQTYYSLKESFDIFEYDRNQVITINRLKKLDVSKEDIRSYIDEVYEFAKDIGLFTITSLRNTGFSSSLDDLGLNEYFYWSLLAQNERFNARRVADSAIIGADTPYNALSIKAFLLGILDDYDSVDPEDLLENVRDEYGLKLDRQDVLNAVRDTDKYYDPIMDKVYRNKMYYYDEFED